MKVRVVRPFTYGKFGGELFKKGQIVTKFTQEDVLYLSAKYVEVIEDDVVAEPVIEKAVVDTEEVEKPTKTTRGSKKSK